jgi:hypothetical protein
LIGELAMLKHVSKYGVLIMLLSLTACATVPAGPSVAVMPTSGKPFDLFTQEDASCRHWAEKQIGVSPQDAIEKNTTTGAVAGTAIGAGLGALIGSTSGNAGIGALIGGAGGLLIGTASGADSGRISGREAQRRYDTAYLQCMYANGNQVAGSRRVVRRAYRANPLVPPPPIASPPQSYESIPPPPMGATPQTPPELRENKGGIP